MGFSTRCVTPLRRRGGKLDAAHRRRLVGEDRRRPGAVEPARCPSRRVRPQGPVAPRGRSDGAHLRGRRRQPEQLGDNRFRGVEHRGAQHGRLPVEAFSANMA